MGYYEDLWNQYQSEERAALADAEADRQRAVDATVTQAYGRLGTGGMSAPQYRTMLGDITAETTRAQSGARALLARQRLAIEEQRRAEQMNTWSNVAKIGGAAVGTIAGAAVGQPLAGLSVGSGVGSIVGNLITGQGDASQGLAEVAGGLQYPQLAAQRKQQMDLIQSYLKQMSNTQVLSGVNGLLNPTSTRSTTYQAFPTLPPAPFQPRYGGSPDMSYSPVKFPWEQY